MRQNAQCWCNVAAFTAGSLHVDSTFSTMSTHYSAVPTKEASELRQGRLQAETKHAAPAREDHAAAVAVRSRPFNLCS
jgi:hypothetical protein